MSLEYLERNTAAIRERITRAAEKAGRQEPLLIAAVKYAQPEEIDYLHRVCGIDHIGENRVQQLLAHWEAIDCQGLNIHFIGSLQTNKVKYIIDKVCMIHSLDSLKLAAEIDRQAKKHGLVMDVLVEINSGAEQSKGGVLPEEAADFCAALSAFDGLRLCGFMTMAPKCEQKEDYLKYFGQTYAQVLDIWSKKLHNIGKPVLSMGMSESFEEAIACGSDMIRVGRGFFVKD
ncbi:MAG: YggS family pyridoxal phosphate-dependent enzyme [Clostridia bacterium]|nr:YggS family pyridoxal phosphate-dependent enzyme [Clostridia bacterium]